MSYKEVLDGQPADLRETEGFVRDLYSGTLIVGELDYRESSAESKRRLGYLIDVALPLTEDLFINSDLSAYREDLVRNLPDPVGEDITLCDKLSKFSNLLSPSKNIWGVRSNMTPENFALSDSQTIYKGKDQE